MADIRLKPNRFRAFLGYVALISMVIMFVSGYIFMECHASGSSLVARINIFAIVSTGVSSFLWACLASWENVR